MDEALRKSGDWPNIALKPGTLEHAATGEHVEQPENTRIGRSRGACRPIGTPGDSEPADVENRPQNGLECDTREKLRDDAMDWLKDHFACSTALMSELDTWLDRQAALTEQNCRLEYEDMRDYLQARVDSLTVENNNLRSTNSFLNDTMTEQIAKLLNENDCIEVSERGIDGKRRLATGTQHKLEKQVEELTAERDDLRSSLKTQADSFAKLERENAEMRDKLERVREMAGGDA